MLKFGLRHVFESDVIVLFVAIDLGTFRLTGSSVHCGDFRKCTRSVANTTLEKKSKYISANPFIDRRLSSALYQCQQCCSVRGHNLQVLPSQPRFVSQLGYSRVICMTSYHITYTWSFIKVQDLRLGCDPQLPTIATKTIFESCLVLLLTTLTLHPSRAVLRSIPGKVFVLLAWPSPITCVHVISKFVIPTSSI